jgi:DNA-binding phage protein
MKETSQFAILQKNGRLTIDNIEIIETNNGQLWMIKVDNELKLNIMATINKTKQKSITKSLKEHICNKFGSVRNFAQLKGYSEITLSRQLSEESNPTIGTLRKIMVDSEYPTMI